MKWIHCVISFVAFGDTYSLSASKPADIQPISLFAGLSNTLHSQLSQSTYSQSFNHIRLPPKNLKVGRPKGEGKTVIGLKKKVTGKKVN